jgi:hypothetical protein
VRNEVRLGYPDTSVCKALLWDDLTLAFTFREHRGVAPCLSFPFLIGDLESGSNNLLNLDSPNELTGVMGCRQGGRELRIHAALIADSDHLFDWRSSQVLAAVPFWKGFLLACLSSFQLLAC